MHLLAQHIPPQQIIAALMITVLIAAWTDLKRLSIPNQLLAPSAATALMLSTFLPGAQGLSASLLGGVTGLLIFMPLYLLKGMAAGDLKLMAVIGLYTGTALTLDIALLTALLGGAWIVVLFKREMYSSDGSPSRWGICLRHRSTRLLRKLNDGNTKNKSLLIPYGAVIATGTLSALMIASSR